MFLFLCSFSIVFWGCLDLFYFYLRFIKNFQIIREEFPFFSQFFTIHLNCCGGLDIVRNPGGRHTQALVGYAIRPPEPVCACRPCSSRCGSIYLLVALPTAIAVGKALCMFVILLRFPLGCCRGLALCVLIICVCFARSPPGSLGFARPLRGFAQA